MKLEYNTTSKAMTLNAQGMKRNEKRIVIEQYMEKQYQYSIYHRNTHKHKPRRNKKTTHVVILRRRHKKPPLCRNGNNNQKQVEQHSQRRTTNHRKNNDNHTTKHNPNYIHKHVFTDSASQNRRQRGTL